MAKHRTVPLYEDEFDAILRGLGILKGSVQYMFTLEKLIAKLEKHRDKLRYTNAKIRAHDDAERGQHAQRKHAMGRRTGPVKDDKADVGPDGQGRLQFGEALGRKGKT